MMSDDMSDGDCDDGVGDSDADADDTDNDDSDDDDTEPHTDDDNSVCRCIVIRWLIVNSIKPRGVKNWWTPKFQPWVQMIERNEFVVSNNSNILSPKISCNCITSIGLLDTMKQTHIDIE